MGLAKYIDSTFADIFKGIDPKRLHIPNEITVPNDFYQHLLDYVLERGYLNELCDRNKFVDFNDLPNADFRKITWLKVLRLPIHPNELKEYDLLSRWQAALAALHTWGHRLIFLMQRKNGETTIYLGTASLTREVSAAQAIEQFKEATMSTMPGIDLYSITNKADLQELTENLLEYNTIGAVTGIPSFKQNSQFGILQTLDQLAFGIRDTNNNDSDYSLMVIADPLDDVVISETISKFRKLGSEIHTGVMRSVTETESVSETKGSNFNVATTVATLMGAVLGIPIASLPIMAISSIFSKSVQKNVGYSKATTSQYLDKFAKYAEELTDRHCERLKKGRNLGFWNVGIYTLGKSRKDINTVMGMLRSIYSGDETFVEPIRVHLLKDNSGAIDIVRRGELVPMVSDGVDLTEAMGEWNIFGKAYQYISTPLNTEELSIATSLPRRDVPGLRFVKTSIRFANNPAVVNGDTICLGRVVDIGVVQNNEYRIDPNALVRHAIVTGSTGSGKSTTCKTIISEILKRDIPALIIEPAKDDYVRWAIEYNKSIDADKSLSKEEKEKKKFMIYMPGLEKFDNVELGTLKLNPFQPAGIPNAPIDMMTRCEQITSLINASLPVSDVLPVLIDEALYKYAYEVVGEDFLKGEMKPLLDYPKLEGVVSKARAILTARGYDKKVQDDIGAALETRFAYLTRGKRGSILNVNNSTNYTKLFNRPTILNLSKIASTKDKALIMSILMLSLYEYRTSCYTNDEEYRKKAQQNKLLHLTVIEEAHNLLLKPSIDTGNSGNPQQVAADLFSNMLSEIRGYGQGVMIVDQIPSRLIQDAIKNTNYKIVHRLTAPDDCAVMASGLALREDQQKIIPALSVGDAIICGDLDDAAAWVKLNKHS
jgi:hypothetical protein